MDKSVKNRERVRCIKPWANIFINDNRIKVCCWSEVVLGKLTEHTSLKDFWNSKEAQMIRRRMLDDNLSGICPGICPNLDDGSDNFLKFKQNRNKFKENESLIFESIKEGRQIIHSKPVGMDIAMDHDCNLRCIMCVGTLNPAYRISGGIYNLTDELSGSLRRIFFTGGEPFYSDRVYQFIRHCIKKEDDLEFGFITNGLNIDMELIKEIKVLDICFSIDGATKEIYEKIRQRARFEIVMKNLKRVLEYRRNNNYFTVKVMFVVMASNFREIHKMINLVEDMGVELRFIPIGIKKGHPENIFEQEKHLNELLSIIRKASHLTKCKTTLNELRILELLAIKNILSRTSS